jgi:hypothetical protein
MTQEKLEKYLKNYLKEVITPRFRKMYDDDSLEIILDHIKESENYPGMYRLFLGVNPPQNENILYIELTDDVYTFFDMLGFENLPVIFWSDDDVYVRPT